MDLRKKIGSRISEARKVMGLTITDLVKKSENLSIGRVSNWERGTRSPRPGEIILLAELLNVSANYLLCTTDDPRGESQPIKRVRVLPLEEISKIGAAEDVVNVTSREFITIENYTREQNSHNLFAIRVADNSMEPEFHQGDIIIVDTQLLPKPGDYVLVYLSEKKQVLFRKYREVQNCLFQLLALNELWAALDIKAEKDATVLGVITEHRRFFRR